MDYKDVPFDWKQVDISELCLEGKRGIKPGPFGSAIKKSMYVGNGYKVYGQEQVIPNDFSIGDYYIDKEKFEELKKFSVKKKDLLISLVGTFGKIAIVPESAEEGIINPRLMKITFDEQIADVEFYQHFMLSSSFKKQAELLSQGGTMGVISKATIMQIPFIKPPLPEQQKIAKILSSVDNHIDEVNAMIQDLKELKKGLMQKLLTEGIGHTEFKDSVVGRIPVEWEVVKIKEITNSNKQGYYTKDKYVEGGIPLVRITDLHSDHIAFENMPLLNVTDKDYESFKIQKGDFIFARSGSIGRYGIVTNNNKAIFGSYLIRFRFNSNIIENRYFGYIYESQITQKQLKSITQGSSNININADNIKSINIPLPSIKEQNSIVKILSGIDERINIYKNNKENLTTLKKGLMQQLLTGKTRVKTN